MIAYIPTVPIMPPPRPHGNREGVTADGEIMLLSIFVAALIFAGIIVYKSWRI